MNRRDDTYPTTDLHPCQSRDPSIRGDGRWMLCVSLIGGYGYIIMHNR